jgi:inner membrane protein
MDNVTHTLTGLALARAGASRSGRGATLMLVLASNLPDVDLVTAAFGNTSYLAHHRGLTHSVLGAPILAALAAGLLRLLVEGSRFLPLLLCGLLGVATHVFMDLWTTYGTRILEPFSHLFFTLDLVFIIDPLILVLLVLALLPAKETRARARVALVAIAAYVAARGILHARALEILREEARGATRIEAIPSPIDPFAWKALADCGSVYRVGSVSLLRRSTVLETRAKAQETRAVVAAEKAPSAAVFLRFSPFPWLEVEQQDDLTRVLWTDLRFEGHGKRFEEEVVVSESGAIVSQGFHF